MIIDFFHKGGGGSEYVLPKATENRLGGIKVGDRLSIDGDGKLSANDQSYTLPIAASDTLGGVKVGSHLSIDANGVLSGEEGMTTGQVQTQITNTLTAYTPTTGFSTVNGSAITQGGNITIQGGGGDPNAEKVQVLTQSEYNALTGYSANTTYVISDAAAIDMDDYASLDALDTVSAATNTALATKANKQNIASPFTGASYSDNVSRFPVWNAEGVITGNDGNTWGAGSTSINGQSKRFMAKDAATFEIYAPTAVGSNGQVLKSTGSGAPSWVNLNTLTGGLSFWKGTQAEYDAIATKDANTLYVITD